MEQKKNTWFVDIDGTLIKYRSFDLIPHTNPQPIQDVIDLVNEEYEKGSFIVLTSARPISMKNLTMQEMKHLGVKFNYLLLGIGRGTRFLVNDMEPHSSVKKAIAVNVKRDKGLSIR